MRYDLGYQLRKSYFLNIFRKYSTSNKLNDELYYENIYCFSLFSFKEKFQKVLAIFCELYDINNFPLS